MKEQKKTISVFQVLRLVRDARSTKGAERQLLMALVLRCNPKENFKCWPSYALLAKDVQLDPMTLKRAAKKLEDREIIKRVIRPNHSNLFFINVALLQEQAAAANAPVVEEACPFADPVPNNSVNPVEAEDAETDGDDWNAGGAQ